MEGDWPWVCRFLDLYRGYRIRFPGSPFNPEPSLSRDKDRNGLSAAGDAQTGPAAAPVLGRAEHGCTRGGVCPGSRAHCGDNVAAPAKPSCSGSAQPQDVRHHTGAGGRTALSHPVRKAGPPQQ